MRNRLGLIWNAPFARRAPFASSFYAPDDPVESRSDEPGEPASRHDQEQADCEECVDTTAGGFSFEPPNVLNQIFHHSVAQNPGS